MHSPISREEHGRSHQALGALCYNASSGICDALARHKQRVVPVYNGRFRIIPLEIVLGDVRQQAAAGARHITFGDPDFFNGPTHSLRIVKSARSDLRRDDQGGACWRMRSCCRC
jgi:hypothetical protein